MTESAREEAVVPEDDVPVAVNNALLRMLLLAGIILALTGCFQRDVQDRTIALTVSPGEATLTVDGEDDGSVQLTAELKYESGRTVIADVIWESDNPAIAAVTAGGLVTAIAEGSAKVTAVSTQDATLTAFSAVSVAAAETEGVPDDSEPTDPEEPGDGNGPGGGEDPEETDPPDDGDEPAENTLVLSEDSLALVRTQIVGIRAEAKVEGNASGRVNWHSSDSGVVEVSPLGPDRAMLRATGVGTATLTATSVADRSLQASIQVSVTALEVEVSYSFDTPLDGLPGTATAVITNEFAGANLALSWSSEPPDSIDFADGGESRSGSPITFTARDGLFGPVTISARSMQDPDSLDAVSFEVFDRFALDPLNVYVGPWPPPPDDDDSRDGDPGTIYNPFDTIKEGLDAARTLAVAMDDEGKSVTVHIARSDYGIDTSEGGLPVLDFPVKLLGEDMDETRVVLGVSEGEDTYGFLVQSDGVHLENLTIENENGTAVRIRAAAGSEYRIRDISLTNVTVSSSGLTLVEVQSADSVRLQNVSLTGELNGDRNEGAGVTFTAASNVVLDGVTTRHNLWGGAAFYVTDGDIEGVTVTGTEFTEPFSMYIQHTNRDYSISGLHLAGFDYAVRSPVDILHLIGDDFTGYFQDLEDAALLATLNNLLQISSPMDLMLGGATIQRVSSTEAAEHPGTLYKEFQVFPTMNIQAALDAGGDEAAVIVNGTFQLPQTLDVFGFSVPPELIDGLNEYYAPGFMYSRFTIDIEHREVTLRGSDGDPVQLLGRCSDEFGLDHPAISINGANALVSNLGLARFSTSDPSLDNRQGIVHIGAEGAGATVSGLTITTVPECLNGAIHEISVQADDALITGNTLERDGFSSADTAIWLDPAANLARVTIDGNDLIGGGIGGAMLNSDTQVAVAVTGNRITFPADSTGLFTEGIWLHGSGDGGGSLAGLRNAVVTVDGNTVGGHGSDDPALSIFFAHGPTGSTVNGMRVDDSSVLELEAGVEVANTLASFTQIVMMPAP